MSNNRKFLIVEKNLIKAMRMEKMLKDSGAESIGIATDYVTSMLLIKDQTPDVVFINPNLTLEGEGLGVANEIQLVAECDIFIFTAELSDVLKERFLVAHSYVFVMETDDECLKSALVNDQTSSSFVKGGNLVGK
ncbi:MAG: two-component SAPR family response regulator [Glaciecola sp.]|jgi:two-component SAPR family response regulator